MNDAPRYDAFLASERKGGWATDILSKMEPGTPVLLPKNVDAASLVRLARRRGTEIRVRTFGADKWACLLRPEDVRLPRQYKARQ